MAFWFRKKTRVRELRIELEQLEERIVLDASIDAVSQPDNPDSDPMDTAENPDQSNTNPASQGQAPEPENSSDDPLSNLFDQSLNVILIADNVDQIDAIKASANESAIVMEYDSHSDSMVDIVSDLEVLVDESGEPIGHLAILSHGDPGYLEISDLSVISAENINNNQALWQNLGTLMTGDARIDLYGCEVASGADGVALVNSMASTTQATVWASDDMTGSDDWELEVKSSTDSRDYLLDHSMLSSQALELGVVDFVNGSFENGDYTGWNLVDYDYDYTQPTIDGAQYYYGMPTVLDSGTEIVMHYQVHDYADNMDVYVYPWAETTYTATDGSKVAAQLSNGPYRTVFSQDLSLSNGVTKVMWDMSYTNYHSDFSATQGITVSVIPQTGDPEILFQTSPGDPLTSSMSGYWSNISKFGGSDVTFQVEVIGQEFFLDASFDNFRLDTNKTPFAIDQVKPGFEDEAMVIALGGNDGDPDLDQELTFYIGSLPSNGALYATQADALSGSNPLSVDDSLADNKVWHITDPNDHSDGSFTFYVQDDGGAANPGEDTSAPGLVELVIEPVNDPPIAIDGETTTSGTIQVTLWGYDADKPDVADVDFDVDRNTAHGSVSRINGETIQTDGAGNYSLVVEYDPDNGFIGTDEIHFTFNTPGGPWIGFETGNGDRFGGGQDKKNSYDIVAGDINNDGIQDLVAAVDGGRNRYYLGDGNGDFIGGYDVGPEGYTSCVAQLGDLNGDGYLDVAFRNYRAPDMIYFWDHNNNTFSAGVALANSSDGGMGSIGFGDVDGDGDLDIAVAKNYAVDLLYINDGAGNFGIGSPLNTESFGVTSTMDMGDVDGDGYADIVIGKYGASDLLLLSDGDGGFDNIQPLPLPSGIDSRVQYIDMGDVDGDGDVDIVAANDTYRGADGIEIFYRNESNQGFTPFTIGTGGDDSGSIKLVDVDLDGDLDALVGNNGGDPNQYYLFDSDTGQFTSGVEIGGRQYDTFGATFVDYDSDGDMDYVAATAYGGKKRVFENLGFDPAESDPGVITVTVTSGVTGNSLSSPLSASVVGTTTGADTSSASFSDPDMLGGLFTTSSQDSDLLKGLTPIPLEVNSV